MPRTSTQQSDLVNFALIGIDLQIKELGEKRRELSALLPARGRSAEIDPTLETSGRGAPEMASPRRKRKVSAATRAKLKASAKARWARVRKQAGGKSARQRQTPAAAAKKVPARRSGAKAKTKASQKTGSQ